MGSILVGAARVPDAAAASPMPSSLKLDREMLERGLTNSVRDNDERFPPEWRLSHRGRPAE